LTRCGGEREAAFLGIIFGTTLGRLEADGSGTRPFVVGKAAFGISFADSGFLISALGDGAEAAGAVLRLVTDFFGRDSAENAVACDRFRSSSLFRAGVKLGFLETEPSPFFKEGLFGRPTLLFDDTVGFFGVGGEPELSVSGKS
jgi:hypothetical protein